MKKKKLAILVSAILAASILGGCSQESPNEEKLVEERIQSEVNKDVLAKVNEEKEDLRKILENAKKEDPNIQSMYYSFDNDGNKVLNIVKEESDGSFSTNVMSAFVAMALMNNLSSNNYSAFRSELYKSPQKKINHLNKDEQKKYYSGGTASYVSSMKRMSYNNIKNDSTKINSIKSEVRASNAYKASGDSSSVQKGALSSSSSSRSSTYSSGG